ncbi:hypothetical protein SBF1_9100002 [Candidatus Desulfosporosinus infrequens]|uniref:Virulence protein n=1 Tax=Candidatus Desulfosporosinus infrequens TaxID=2043169 RepID=A0A2U3LWW0_9FIRM|nr:hypothetical protein SBF1_9100002 [Candidatus Desulfosporosinus infrequens]
MNEIQFLMYDADEKVEVLVQDETIWATQKTIAELFDVDRTSISRHLKNIFKTDELDEKVVSAEIAHTTQHGAMEGKTQTKPVKYYNLDAIISIGHRVNSHFATSMDEFLKFNRYEILEGHGPISQSAATKKTIGEYKEFNKHQKIISDFDREVKKLQGEQK